ncbi:MAG TPA: DegQ family serine endoprotease [Thermodesulfobacteriaceae bacterium]|nr:DegQ family serine endoprotease [Thermodesulfobacteriaceae bacterium]
MRKRSTRNCTACLVATFLFIAAMAGNCPASDSDEENIALLDRTAKAFAAVVEKAMPAVVFVSVEKIVKRRAPAPPFSGGDPFGFFNDPFFERFFGPRGPGRDKPREFHQRGQGSGFIISKDGYILTNNHVVGDADIIKVKLPDGREFEAKVIGTDPQSDVAVIKIDSDGSLPVLALGNSDALEVGEWVIAIGNPFGLTQTVTVGVVSAKGRSRVGINDYENFIQTDAAINPGNSGGPLINIRGEAVGMNTAIFSRSGGYMGIGFAIPINMATKIKDQLIKKGKVTRGWLGVVIQDIDEDLAKSFGLKNVEGVLIAEVTDDSPAWKAGLKQGDVVLKLNGRKVDDVAELRNRIALTAPGTEISLDVLRNGKKKSVNVIIGEKPSQAVSLISRNEMLSKLGLGVQDLTSELAEQFGYKKGQGVLVVEVEADSLAASAGIRSGQLVEEVNRRRVHNTEELIDALSISKKSNRVLFRIRDGEFSRYVAIRLK